MTAEPHSGEGAPGAAGRVLEDAAALAETTGALLGIDLGSKTVGVAVSDARRVAATPLETIPRKKFAAVAQRLGELMRGRQIAGIVVGLPRNMDGSEGPGCQAARAFARNLAERFGLPVALQDERLSTVAAEEALIEAGSSRRRRAEVIDKVAAALILRAALDRLATAPGVGEREA